MNPEIRRLQDTMRGQGYVAERPIVTALHLARSMERPLLVEGDAGVGKTEIAKVMAAILETELIRLQCYEGLDVSTALYEWNYQKQLLRLRIAADGGPGGAAGGTAKEGVRRDGSLGQDALEELIFGRGYLLERPLLRAITRKAGAPVLLIDEIDRADEGFEAFLLEVLSDFQVTIPELGTIRAAHRPLVILTSNRTREIGDALRRRCLYLYIEHPSFDKEVAIVLEKVPGIGELLARRIAAFVQELRGRALMKPPGVAETLDWARALITLGLKGVDAEVARATLGCLVKDCHDMRDLERDGGVDALVKAAEAR